MKSSIVPKLRFKEFTDKWQEKKLGGISDLITKGTTPTSVGFGFLREGINFIKAENISKNGFIDIESTPKISPECNESLRRSQLKKDDLLFSIAGTLGRTAVVKDKDLPANTNQALAIIRLKKENDLGFIHLFLNLPKIKRRVYQILSIGAQPNLSLEQVGDFKISLPSLIEQQKIADFLGAIDEKIEKLEAKKKAFEKYKKGIMQAIFSQKIRFKKPDGSNFPDWEEKKLGEILKERKTYSSKSTGYEHISLTTAGVVPKSERYERDFLVRSSDKNYKITKIDDICYNPANLKFGVIARNKYKLGIFSPIYITFEVSNSDVGFVELMVTRKDFIQKARRYEQGTVYERMAVSSEDLLKVVVQVPCIEEQEKIAVFLTALDNKINFINNQLEQARLFKKSLLQGMFV